MLPMPELLVFFLLKLIDVIPILMSDLEALDLAALLVSLESIYLDIFIPPDIGILISYGLVSSPCFCCCWVSTINTVGNPSSPATAAACIIFFYAIMSLPSLAALLPYLNIFLAPHYLVCAHSWLSCCSTSHIQCPFT